MTDQTATSISRSTSIKSTTAIWKGNMDICFFICCVLSIWFTVGRGIAGVIAGKIPGNISVDTLICVHILNAIVTSWAMMWNIFHPPGHGSSYRLLHRWIGWLCMITGTVSTVMGFLNVWVFQQSGPAMDNAGFSIGISIGGVLQMGAQFSGLHCIRKGDRDKHSKFMSMAFYGGCCVPAIMRLPEMFGYSWSSWNYFAWIIPVALGQLSIAASDSRKRRIEEGNKAGILACSTVNK